MPGIKPILTTPAMPVRQVQEDLQEEDLIGVLEIVAILDGL
jgi:hypothetical protein